MDVSVLHTYVPIWMLFLRHETHHGDQKSEAVG